MRVQCLAQQHNTMSPAKAQTQTAQSGDEGTNHEATAPPTDPDKLRVISVSIKQRSSNYTKRREGSILLKKFYYSKQRVIFAYVIT